MRRWTIGLLWLVAEPYQLFFGALTSLQLGAPGVGDRAAWTPNALVAEGFTVLPIGFALLLWGSSFGRRTALACALALAVVAGAAAIALSRDPAEWAVFFALLAPPWLALLASATRMGRAASPG